MRTHLWTIVVLLALHGGAASAQAPTADTHSVKGFELLKVGKPIEAITEFNEALKLDPKFIAAHFGLGQAYQAKGELPEAIKEYSAATDLNPTAPEFFLRLGSALAQADKPNDALVAFKRAADLSP